MDLGLGGQRKRYTEVAFADFGDLGVGGRFLPGKLVAGHSKDSEALLSEVVVQHLKPGVVRGKTTLGGDVHHQHHLALEAAEIMPAPSMRVRGME